MSNKIIVNGDALKIKDVYDVSLKNKEVSFPDDLSFKNKINKCRDFLESYIKKGYPVYGVTTGFGDSCHNQISPEKSELLQRSLVNFHGVGFGNFFSEEECRAVTLVRLNSNAKGYSAVRLEVLELMRDFLNNGIVPVIPELGSVGASGDLTPLSYLAAALMGERKCYYKGQILDAKDGLKKAGLKPVKLQAKEGLALMNGTSVMTAIAALAYVDIEKLANISDFLTGVTVGILNGNDIPYRSKVSEIKNHPGQLESAEKIYKVVEDTKRVHKYEHLLNKIGTIEENQYKKTDFKIQDRYSVRCAPQITGVLRDTLSFSKVWIENELNSANDNPLIDAENNIIYNSGNFYGGHMSCACDYLRIALANISDLSEKQAELIVDGKYNSLTENLIPDLEGSPEKQGLFHGFKAAQISITALCSEIQFLSAPVSIHSRPTEAMNQDKVSLGTISARKLREMVDLLYIQFGIHLAAVLQAIDLIGKNEFNGRVQKVYNELRKIVAFVKEDRPLDNEIRALSKFLKESEIFNNLD